VILLDDYRSLAAPSGPRSVVRKKATSPHKNRVWNFLENPSGRRSSDALQVVEIASGSITFTYKIASGLREWLSRDPLENAEISQGPNLYAYVTNDPINLIDPDGQSVIGKVLVYGYKGAKKARMWITKSEVADLLKDGEEVVCKTRSSARDAAKAASKKGKEPIFEVDGATGNPHFHPNPRTGGHVTWTGRSIVGSVTLGYWASGHGQVAQAAAFVGDLVNPLSIGQDILDIGDDFFGDSEGGKSGTGCGCD